MSLLSELLECLSSGDFWENIKHCSSCSFSCKIAPKQTVSITIESTEWEGKLFEMESETQDSRVKEPAGFHAASKHSKPIGRPQTVVMESL